MCDRLKGELYKFQARMKEKNVVGEEFNVVGEEFYHRGHGGTQRKQR